MKKKILFVITKSNFGGAQKQVYELATALPRGEFDVAVAAGGTGEGANDSGMLLEKLKERGIATHFVAALGKELSVWGDLFSFIEIIQLTRRVKPDIVHLHSSKMAAYGALAARLSGVPKIIATIHGWAFNEDRFFLVQIVFWIAHYIGALAASKVVLINSADRRKARFFIFCQRKFLLIPNGIRPPAFVARETARETLSKKYTVPPSNLWIGSVGELTKNKDYSALLEALAKLEWRGARFSSLLIGDGEERKKLEQEARARGIQNRVFFLGYLSEASRYLTAFDLFVLPSLKEGLPYALLEAGSASLAVVATNVGGVPDIIEHEQNGLLVRAKDSDQLASAIRNLTSDPTKRAALGKALNEKVSSYFGFETMFRKYLNEFRN